MLPGKAEKRMASSIFITLVPPRREETTKERNQRELQLDGAEVLGTHRPKTPSPRPPTLPNGGEGCPCRGVIGCYFLSKHLFDVIVPLNTLCLAFTLETCPVIPVLSSPPVLILSEAPQPLSAEALGPALQQLDLAAPSTLQAPSAFPAKLKPPKFCQEQAGKPQWRDENGYLERDSSRGKRGCTARARPRLGKLRHRMLNTSPFFPVDICAFCHKAVGPREPTVEAMRKQYHADCFTCRTCHRLLAGQRYYQRDGRPTCDTCYQATLEKCAKCGGLITERIVRALGKGYHPGCFSCVACGRAIGAESFAVDERDEVYCVTDFYRKYAVVCSACEHPIVPREDKDTYKIECLGRSFHESCYRCESCGTPLSPEPTENGCYPLDNHLLCKPCHVRWRNESSC
ncbi:FBLI1 protein, partial [Chordeiles acutipennis]|nr:FBLI1 protein [Chordeiles acutipennis]